MYRVDVTPVVGLPQFRGWSQVISHNFNSRQLVCAFSVAGDHAGNAGRDFTERLAQAQANTSQELNQLIADLLVVAKDLDVKLQLACGVFGDKSLILGTNSGSVFLKRGDRTGTLLSSIDQTKIIEGKRREGDVVVLLTHQAGDFANEIEQKFNSGFETDSVVTSIIPGLHGQDDSSLSSLAFVAGGQEYNDEEDDPESAEPELEADAQPEPENDELLFDIPPALKLRGAGKKREVNPFQIKSQPTAAKNPVFSDLGQSQAKTISMPAPVIKLGQTLGSWLAKLGGRIKQIKWRELWVKIVRFFSQVKGLLVEFFKRSVAFVRKITAKDIYLQPGSSRKIFRTLLPIVAGILIIGGLVGFRIYQLRQQLKNAASMLQPITTQISDAKAKVETEPILAREEVTQAIAQLEQLEKDFADQRRAKQLVVDELASARELYEQISGQEEFGQLEIFYDLRLAESDFLVSALDADQQQVVFLDQEKKLLISLDLSSKQINKVALSDNLEPKDLEVSGQTAYLLASGVLTQNIAEAESNLSQVIEEGDSNRDATLVESFISYVYVLNPAKRNIYRYAQQEEGYSDPIGWVSGAAGFDYEQVSSWEIRELEIALAHLLL